MSRHITITTIEIMSGETTMNFIETDLARELHRERLVEVEESRRARRATAISRLERRAARLTHKAERVSRQAERAASQARLAVARVL